jgi:hypothetical protein
MSLLMAVLFATGHDPKWLIEATFAPTMQLGPVVLRLRGSPDRVFGLFTLLVEFAYFFLIVFVARVLWRISKNLMRRQSADDDIDRSM